MSHNRCVLLFPLLLTACGTPPDTDAETVVPAQQLAEKYEMRGMTDLPGTPYLVTSLYKKDGSPGYSSGKGAYSARNVVLFHRETGDAISLLPDERGYVDDIYFVPARAASNTQFEEYASPFSGLIADGTVSAPSYYVVTYATIKEGERSYNLYIGSADDWTGGTILTDMTTFSQYWMLDETRLAAVANVDDRDVFHVIDLIERRVISTKSIEPVRVNAAD